MLKVINLLYTKMLYFSIPLLFELLIQIFITDVIIPQTEVLLDINYLKTNIIDSMLTSFYFLVWSSYKKRERTPKKERWKNHNCT